MRSVQRYLVALILVISVVAFRLSYLAFSEYKLDESTAVKLAYDNLHSGPALTGLRSSAGIYNPPFFVYLISLPVLFTSDPVLVTGFVAAINVIALFFLFFIVKKYFSERTAVITLLLFASSPWVTLYSRKIWAQDCLVPFLIMFYGLLFSCMESYSRAKVLGLFILFSLLTQLHLSAWFMALPVLAFILIFRVRIKMLDLIMGCFLFALSYAPYIYFHVLNGFPQPALAGRSDIYGNLAWSFIINGATNFNYYLGSGFDMLFEQYNLAFSQVFFNYHLAILAAGLLFVAFSLARKLKEHPSTEAFDARDKLLSLFLLIYVFVQVSFIIFKVGGYPHYNIILYPILAVFAGYFVDFCYQKYGAAVRTLISAIVGLIVLSNLYFTASFFDFIKRQPEWINGDYGIPYCLQAKAREQTVHPVISVKYE